MLGHHPPVRLPAESPPQLIVVIDTEEEFDWNADADREATAVTAMNHIDRVQDIFDEYKIVPCYVIDYPVVSQVEGYTMLRDIQRRGGCEIGAHLHPWVNPPYDEELTPVNTFVGNLSRELEFTKLRNLTDAIDNIFGERPVSYKAGRYGVGPNTTGILQELGYEIDLSLCPPVDYRPDGGPDFSDCHAEPFWFGDNQQLLEIPVTGSFVGWAGGASKALYNLAGKLHRLKMRGILSRLSVVDRLMLSPEGFDSDEHLTITKSLYNRGVRTFTWSFHSPSVVPGLTPYVQSEADLEKFLDSFRRFFDYFFGELCGVATTPTRLKSHLEALK